MGKASFARSGSGSVSKSVHARSGIINKATSGEVFGTAPQPKVPSNIPNAGPAGVPPASADKMGEFARKGNADMRPTIVSAQTGLATYGPAVAGSVARSGGQVRLAPSQMRAWAHPKDPSPKTSEQVLNPNIPTKVV